LRVLRSAVANASADKSRAKTRRSFSVGGQAQHEDSLIAIDASAGWNFLILSLSKDA
jgi:hypothetical protein